MILKSENYTYSLQCSIYQSRDDREKLLRVVTKIYGSDAEKQKAILKEKELNEKKKKEKETKRERKQSVERQHKRRSYDDDKRSKRYDSRHQRRDSRDRSHRRGRSRSRDRHDRDRYTRDRYDKERSNRRRSRDRKYSPKREHDRKSRRSKSPKRRKIEEKSFDMDSKITVANVHESGDPSILMDDVKPKKSKKEKKKKDKKKKHKKEHEILEDLSQRLNNIHQPNDMEVSPAQNSQLINLTPSLPDPKLLPVPLPVQQAFKPTQGFGLPGSNILPHTTQLPEASSAENIEILDQQKSPVAEVVIPALEEIKVPEENLPPMPPTAITRPKIGFKLKSSKIKPMIQTKVETAINTTAEKEEIEILVPPQPVKPPESSSDSEVSSDSDDDSTTTSQGNDQNQEKNSGMSDESDTESEEFCYKPTLKKEEPPSIKNEEIRQAKISSELKKEPEKKSESILNSLIAKKEKELNLPQATVKSEKPMQDDNESEASYNPEPFAPSDSDESILSASSEDPISSGEEMAEPPNEALRKSGKEAMAKFKKRLKKPNKNRPNTSTDKIKEEQDTLPEKKSDLEAIKAKIDNAIQRKRCRSEVSSKSNEVANQDETPKPANLPSVIYASQLKPVGDHSPIHIPPVESAPVEKKKQKVDKKLLKKESEKKVKKETDNEVKKLTKQRDRIPSECSTSGQSVLSAPKTPESDNESVARSVLSEDFNKKLRLSLTKFEKEKAKTYKPKLDQPSKKDIEIESLYHELNKLHRKIVDLQDKENKHNSPRVQRQASPVRTCPEPMQMPQVIQATNSNIVYVPMMQLGTTQLPGQSDIKPGHPFISNAPSQHPMTTVINRFPDPRSKENKQTRKQEEFAKAINCEPLPKFFNLLDDINFLCSKENAILNKHEKKMSCECVPEYVKDEEGAEQRTKNCGDGCLNKEVNIECHPGLCPCKELCQNQRLQRKEYADCSVFYS